MNGVLLATDVIRVGVVGAGFFGAMIANACGEHPDFAVTSVTDLNLDAAAALAEQRGGTASANVAELVARDDVDLVVVATPNHLHAAPAIAALVAGKHVFVEKPMAISEADIDAMMAAAEASPGRLVVGHVVRTFPGVRRTVEAARAGSLGRILEVSGERRRVVHLPAGKNDWWKTDRSRTGGELLHEIHELDLVVWALGEAPEAVTHVAGAPAAHGADVPEGVVAPDSDEITALRAASGAIGLHTVSTSAHRARWGFRVSGTEAAVEIDFRAATVIRYVDGAIQSVSGVFDNAAANESLRESATQAQGYNTGGAGPVWMQTAVQGELTEVARALRGESDVLCELPDTAARVAIRVSGDAARSGAQSAAESSEDAK